MNYIVPQLVGPRSWRTLGAALLLSVASVSFGAKPGNCIAPTIATQPASRSVVIGASTTLSVSVSGTTPISYQWRKAGVALVGATNASYTINPVTTNSAGGYRVEAVNRCGSVTSAVATVTLLLPPVITSQPQSLAVPVGATASFSVVASGSTPMSYRWRKNSVLISGATSSTYSLLNVSTNSAASYSVIVSNAAGTATSMAAILTLLVPPSITGQPGSVTVVEGGSATFSASVSGSAPLSLQWRKDGVNVASATNRSLVISPVSVSSQGIYTLRASNAVGSVTSTGAVLTVLTPPVITGQPGSVTVVGGGSATFSASVSGSAPLSLQWRKDGVNVASATNSSLVISPVSVSSQGTYTLRASNAAGSVTSAPATLTVILPPTIISQPLGLVVIGGDAAAITVAASGSAPLTYQWFKAGIALDGAISSQLTFPSATASDAGVYFVVVSNPAGTVTSSNATLTVLAEGNAPKIISHSGGGTYLVGSTTVLSVTVTGSIPMTCQWYFNGAALVGATGTNFALENLQLGDSAVYTCVAENAFGMATNAGLSVNIIESYSGATINFSSALGTNSFYVYDSDGVTLLSGPRYLAQLYVEDPSGSFVAVGAPAPFMTGAQAGRLFGGTRYVPWATAGAAVSAQVRAWDTQDGDSYESAALAQGKVGASNIASIRTGGGTAPPGSLAGIHSFSLSGEPSVCALKPAFDFRVKLTLPRSGLVQKRVENRFGS